MSAAVSKNSAPFDPFRLECPFYHGIVKMELRRVESSEGVRTDTMITAYCENVKKLHPSPRDRTLAPNVSLECVFGARFMGTFQF